MDKIVQYVKVDISLCSINVKTVSLFLERHEEKYSIYCRALISKQNRQLMPKICPLSPIKYHQKKTGENFKIRKQGQINLRNIFEQKTLSFTYEATYLKI